MSGQEISLQPHRPQNIPEYALASLQALVAHGLGHKISLGGAFGLAHYYEYRSTHDVDAWWTAEAGTEDQQQVVRAIREALSPFGTVQVRAWGEVVSVELRRGERVVFSFQIAGRSAQLRPSQPVPWIDVLLDSLEDLIAGKMVGLVERGAPRDFRDIYTLCQAGITTPEQCWALWREREQLAGSDADTARACLAVQTHLARIATQRPLESISDSDERAAAEHLRGWFVREFLNASMD